MTYERIRRYTDILSIIDILQNQRLTLLSPLRWADMNDRHAMGMYRTKIGAPGLVALCMTQTRETYHHWQVFAGHPAGACIVFHRKAMLERLQREPSLLHGPVQYMTHEEMESKEFETDELPFLKRDIFRDELEYRVICRADRLAADEVRYIDINLDMIDTIVFSPLAPEPLIKTLTDVLKAMPGAGALHYHHSRLMHNIRWRQILEAKARIDHSSL